MKIAIIAVVAIVSAACMSLRVAENSTGQIKTGSVVYDARYAAKFGLNQTQTTECERQGRATWAKTVGNTAFGGGNNLDAGNAYEACVRNVAGTAPRRVK